MLSTVADETARPQNADGATAKAADYFRKRAAKPVECGSLLPLSPASLLAVGRMGVHLHSSPNASHSLSTLLPEDAKRLTASRLAAQGYSRL